MPTWALVPVKHLSKAKSSLSPILTPRQRRKLVLSMLADVLNIVRRTSRIAGIAVVSPDERLLNFAHSHDAECILEPGLELNEALKFAIRCISSKGADSVLILPADLPSLKAADIENIIEMISTSRGVVVAPSKDNGTNALFLRPPDAIELGFGEESFHNHVAKSLEAGIKPFIYRSPTTTMDIDEVADFVSVGTLGQGTRTYEFLRRWAKSTSAHIG